MITQIAGEPVLVRMGGGCSVGAYAWYIIGVLPQFV
jgi:hypothetical protein